MKSQQQIFIIAFFTIVSFFGQTEQTSAAWVFMGRASTGESISVNDRIDSSGNFTYQIGSNIIRARADCSRNRWFAEGYGWYLPQSSATQQMLNYVCNSILVSQAVPSVSPAGVAIVFDPPSNVRTRPNGQIICSVREQATINIYGSENGWYRTDVCGTLGFIHKSQIRF